MPRDRVGGKYVLVRRIATGGMGDVWVARNELTDAQVALKILRPGRDERTQARDRFRREAKLGGLLAHRSIVRIYDFLEEPDDTLILVMELLRGDTLEELLQKRGPLPEREAIAIAVPILSALQHGHEHAVIHRDVKPANIFLAVDPDGRVIPKLLDFGIAKMPSADKKTLDGVVLGTPSYMSPEQIRTDETIDARSDLFSVGVVLYEMLTGVCPFGAANAGAAIAAVLQGTVDPDPRIEPRLWIELQRAMAKRPAERHGSAAEMAEALCAAIGVTEDELVVRRSKPPPSLVEIPPSAPMPSAPASGVAPSAPAKVVSVKPSAPPPSAEVAREAHTISVDESSALAPSRRRALWSVLAAVLAIGVIVIAVAFGAHRGAPSPASSAEGAPEPSASAVAPPASATVAASSSAPASDATPSVIELPATPPPKPHASAPARAPRRSPRTNHPKGIATTPGF